MKILRSPYRFLIAAAVLAAILCLLPISADAPGQQQPVQTAQREEAPQPGLPAGADLSERTSLESYLHRTLYYAPCGHSVQRREKMPAALAGLTREAFEAEVGGVIPGATVTGFSGEEVDVSVKTDIPCPLHWVLRSGENGMLEVLQNTSGEALEVDGEIYDTFPLQLSKGGERLAISDTKGNFYMVKNAGVLNVTKQEQSSPNDKTHAMQTGDFATAWIDHGRAPKQAGYEYVVYIQPTNKEINRLLKKDEYEVLRKDNTAHVVKDLPTGITGYVCFGAYEGDGLVRRVSEETIVMERTLADGQVVMSVCTPDLGLTEKTYTTRQESQPIEKEVRLSGVWELATPAAGVELAPADAETVLKVTCRHGQPVEFRLKKK